MLDVHYEWFDNSTAAQRNGSSATYLCHGMCNIGMSPLRDALVVIKQFLDENPREVVVLLVEQYVATYSIIEDLEATMLKSYVGYAHPGPSTPWPTLGKLIADGKRLLIFSDKKASFRGFNADGKQIPLANLPADFAAKVNVDWWHYMWDHMTETPYHYEKVAFMASDCHLNRGDPGSLALLSQQIPVGAQAHRLMIANHFVSNPLPCRTCANAANAFSSLAPRMDSCKQTWKHQVNFPTVDFWSVGDIVNVTSYLNNGAT
jgi:hypothetical protein